MDGWTDGRTDVQKRVQDVLLLWLCWQQFVQTELVEVGAATKELCSIRRCLIVLSQHLQCRRRRHRLIDGATEPPHVHQVLLDTLYFHH